GGAGRRRPPGPGGAGRLHRHRGRAGRRPAARRGARVPDGRPPERRARAPGAARDARPGPVPRPRPEARRGNRRRARHRAPPRGRRLLRRDGDLQGGRRVGAAAVIAALCIAGLASSVGKTTVTLALAAAFRRRGLRVRCAKVGPDFIDPGFHEAVTGMPGATLDGWLLDPEALEAAFARAGHGADLVLVEGMMGLFDGLDGSRDAGSTAEVARRLGVPVLLVVDAAAQVRSAAAVVLGAERFDPRLDLAGVVLNRVGGTRHAGWVRDAVAAACRTPVVGALPWREALRLPERHLGLVTARERRLPARLVAALADLAEARIDLDAC